MCFVIHHRCPKPRTVKRDIVCYKEGYRRPDGTFSPYFKTFFNYKLGEVTKLRLECKRWPAEEDHSNTICIGFHSYSNKKELSKGWVDHVKCIIPEGAHYYYNPDSREYVSDQIVVQEFID